MGSTLLAREIFVKKSIVALALATFVLGMSLSAAPSFAQGSEASSSSASTTAKHHHHGKMKHKKKKAESASSSG